MRPELIGSVVQQTWGEGQVSSNGSEFESSYYSSLTQRACEVWRTDTSEGSLVVDALGPILTRSVITLIDVDFTVGSGPAVWTDTFIGTWSIDTLSSILTGTNNQTLVDFCITVFARPSRGTATGVGPKTVVTRGPVLTGSIQNTFIDVALTPLPCESGRTCALKASYQVLTGGSIQTRVVQTFISVVITVPA